MSVKRRLSVPMVERALQQHEKDIDGVLHDSTLQHTAMKAVDKTDFTQEVRGTRDITNFLEKSEVLLDVAETTLEGIVEKLLDVVMDDPKEIVSREELLSLIFSNEERTLLSESLQGTVKHSGSNRYEWEQTWLCGTITIPTLKTRKVGIARLRQGTNLGKNAEEIRFFILILCPSEVKLTKSALETGRTFATLFSDVGLRHDLIEANSVEEFKDKISQTTNMFADHQTKPEANGGSSGDGKGDGDEDKEGIKWYQIGRGIKEDLMGRLPYYLDDYKDGIIGKNTIQKTTATTLFLYFSVILPAVALGVLNSKNTHGDISVQQVIVGQVIGAITFTIFSGQPLVVVMTTAPLALFIKIIYSISEDFGINFLAFYAMIGLWNTFFLVLYSFFNMSVLMKFSSRSTEEIFSNFITIAFITDSTKNMVKTFNDHYWADSCQSGMAHAGEPGSPLGSSLSNMTDAHAHEMMDCYPEVPFLSLILMLGTLWLGVTLFDFTKTPFLNKGKREILSDYALPVAVIVFSLVGTVLFKGVKVKTFPYEPSDSVFQLVDFSQLTVGAIFGAMGLGFSLSLLFFMDQNISAAMVNNPENKLQKGNAYHWDLLVIGLINAFLCVFGLPFLHAVLPHSPLHVKCLADTEERVENGHVRDIVVRVRETRLTNLFSNILIGLSMLFLTYVLDFIPTPVLDGLFLYLAVTALYGNQMFERISLFFMEQSAYPPNHYIRQVPQRKVHIFTACQCCQLLVLCVFGFTPWPYIKMIFPVVILLFLPFRHKVIPMFIEKKYLDVLDGH